MRIPERYQGTNLARNVVFNPTSCWWKTGELFFSPPPLDLWKDLHEVVGPTWL